MTTFRKVSIYRVVSKTNGTFTLDQEANGYWWHHDTAYPTAKAAREAVKARSSEMYPSKIDQDYIPVNMRPR